MSNFFEHILARGWNRMVAPQRRPNARKSDLYLGNRIFDGAIQTTRLVLPESERCEHCAVIGITGKGKSWFLRNCTTQDVRRDSGFLFFDFHGDTTPFLLRLVAAEEQRRGTLLDERLIIIEPGDPEFSVGLNVIESTEGDASYVQISEFARVLKARWHLDSFGARTEELLRNALLVLAHNKLTLLELSLLLRNADFRSRCLPQVQNPEVAEYFRTRFDSRSEAMQGVYADAILNKVSSFTSDPRFRHILGQQRSTFSLVEAMDRGLWVIVNIDKGRLGEDAPTLGSLLLTKVKNSLFARKSRRLFTLYCDEIQNLIAYDAGLETMLSEARKFGSSVVCCNQYVDQFSPPMRAAIMAINTHVFFQLSSSDADRIASAIYGGRHMAELLKNLTKRHFVMKCGSRRAEQGIVPHLTESEVDYSDLYNRCRARWARSRTEVEAEIRARQPQAVDGIEEVLDDWE